MVLKCGACSREMEVPDSMKGPTKCIYCGKPVSAGAAGPAANAPSKPGAAASVPSKPTGTKPDQTNPSKATSSQRYLAGDSKESPVEAMGVVEIKRKVPEKLLDAATKEAQGEKTLLAFPGVAKGCLQGPNWMADEGCFIVTPKRFVFGWRRVEGNQIASAGFLWTGMKLRMELVSRLHQYVRLRIMDSGGRGMGTFDLKPADTEQLVRLTDFCSRAKLQCETKHTPAKGGSMAALLLKNVLLPILPIALWLLSYVLGTVTGVSALAFMADLGAAVNLPLCLVWLAVFVPLMWRPLFDPRYDSLFKKG